MRPEDYLTDAGYLIGWALLFRVPRLPRRAAADSPVGAVSIVIPARNEAATLPFLLADLSASRPPGARVFVVDDGSDDGTAQVARSFPFVEVIQPPPAEPSWVGKSWACHHGAARVDSGTVVFLDADVRLAGDALARVAGLCREKGGLVTVWPHHEVERPDEHLSALPTLVTSMIAGCGSLLPPRRPRCGFGPVMACAVDDYRTVGGHASVRGEVVDDFAIARRFADAGRTVTNLGGGREIRFRMYPGGMRGLVDGWTKSLALGATGADWWRVAGVTMWLTCAIGGLTWVCGLTGWTHGVPRTRNLVYWGLFASQFAVQLRQVGRFWILDALLYPIHVAAFAMLFALSLWRSFVLHRVRWRGRDVSVARPPTAVASTPVRCTGPTSVRADPRGSAEP